MKKTLLVIAGLLLILTSAAAQSNTEELIKILMKKNGPYSQRMVLAGLGDASIFISRYDGRVHKFYTITDQKTGLARLRRGRKANTKITISTSEWVVDGILGSRNPQAAANNAMKTGLIKVTRPIFSFATAPIIVGLRGSQYAGPSNPLPQPSRTFTQNIPGQICGAAVVNLLPLVIKCGPGLVCISGFCQRQIRPTTGTQTPSGRCYIAANCGPEHWCINGRCISKSPGGSTKKRPGEKCNHGGECVTTHCLKIPYSGSYGSYDPATFACSCDAFKYITSC
jgi:hypothetical protein